MTRADWQWGGHASHLVVGSACRFHLATIVGAGRYLVSTVGEWVLPPREIRHSRTAVECEEIFEEIGFGRTYETMVFCVGPELCPCCGFPRPTSWTELDMCGYQDARAAREGHLALCERWDREET